MVTMYNIPVLTTSPDILTIKNRFVEGGMTTLAPLVFNYVTNTKIYVNFVVISG